MPELTLDALKVAAAEFAESCSVARAPSLYGVDNGKIIGTHIEREFVRHLAEQFTFPRGSAARGVDLPSLNVDIKTTSSRQPQSSTPYRSARQKIYGLGHHLLVFVYDKTDNDARRDAILNVREAIYIDMAHTGDAGMTQELRRLLDGGTTTEALAAFMIGRDLPVSPTEAVALAEEVLVSRPEQGVLTISNALQWRLQYGSALRLAGTMDGVSKLR